jgi:hypothetical protein
MPNPYLHPNHRPDPAIIDEYATIGVGELNCGISALSSTR